MISNPVIDKYGNKRWFNEKGELHRDGDLPAIEWGYGAKEWWKKGKRHREQDKPAIECANGTKEWWKNGILYREQDKPAVVWSDGKKFWYKNGIQLTNQEVQSLQRKWKAIRNGDMNLLAKELLNEL